jgi:hypothetical protein
LKHLEVPQASIFGNDEPYDDRPLDLICVRAVGIVEVDTQKSAPLHRAAGIFGFPDEFFDAIVRGAILMVEFGGDLFALLI